MKNYVVVLISFFTLTSCSSGTSNCGSNFKGEWIAYNLKGQGLSGEEMSLKIESKGSKFDVMFNEGYGMYVEFTAKCSGNSLVDTNKTITI